MYHFIKRVTNVDIVMLYLNFDNNNNWAHNDNRSIYIYIIH